MKRAEGVSETLYVDTAQELICSGEALPVVLRLLVLVTLAAGGVPKRYYDSLRREVLHTYGHEHISTLTRLQEAGAQPALRPHAASGERFPCETGGKQPDTSAFLHTKAIGMYDSRVSSVDCRTSAETSTAFQEIAPPGILWFKH